MIYRISIILYPYTYRIDKIDRYPGLSNSPGGDAILLQKITEMLQYGLTYMMRTCGCIRIPDSMFRMSDLARFDIPNF